MANDTGTDLRITAAKQLTALYTTNGQKSADRIPDDKLKDDLKETFQHLNVPVDDALADLLVSPEVIAIIDDLLGFSSYVWIETLNTCLDLIVTGDVQNEELAQAMKQLQLLTVMKRMASRVASLG